MANVQKRLKGDSFGSDFLYDENRDYTKKTSQVRNCPDVAILNSLGLCLFCLCLFIFLSFYLDIILIKCLKGLKSQMSLFVSKF